MKKQNIKIKNILLLQLAVVVYTFSGVMAKLASANKDNIWKMLLFLCGEVFILGIYAIFWQQLMKRFELTVAYANRAIAILWSMLWAALFFQEQITWKNILGVLIVLAGIMIMNTDKTTMVEENTNINASREQKDEKGGKQS